MSIPLRLDKTDPSFCVISQKDGILPTVSQPPILTGPTCAIDSIGTSGRFTSSRPGPKVDKLGMRRGPRSGSELAAGQFQS
jgi:hypothetical protein